MDLPSRHLSLRLFLLLLFSFLMSSFLNPSASTQMAAAATGYESNSASLAMTPPMGWASWNHFFCDYDERIIREQADALVSTGMRDVGYKYVVIQECIAKARDSAGNLIADAVRFPSGIPALTAYIHHLGLKAGIYTDIGKNTCYPNPRYQGSYGHEQQDANTFAAWGVDFVEMDYCNRVEDHTGRWVYERMAQAIKNTGRPMIFYLCAWGNEQPWEWAQGKAQMWRTEYDVSLEKNHVEWGRMVRNFESNSIHSDLSGPGSWNDADMLEIGNPGLNDTEAQAQMSMWAISPSPLLAGADLVHMTDKSKEIYMNRNVIAINQDALGAGAEKVDEPAPGLEIWAKPLASRAGGAYAVMLLNTTERSTAMDIAWSKLDLKNGARVQDIWAAKGTQSMRTGYHKDIPPHSATLLRVEGERAWRHSAVIEAEWPGTARLGNAQLLACGECSRGYGMAIGGDGKEGALSFDKIDMKEGGTYYLRVLYVRNGLEDKDIEVTVNGKASKVRAIMRSWNWVDVPISFQQGENQVSLSYSGDQPFYVDWVSLRRAPQ